jgi:mono/diheme cytochrome c family protein
VDAVTEIPEHLLKRSKDRQQSGATPPTDAVATTSAAAPAAVEKAVAQVAPPALPDPSYVAAAKSRKKIPFWAMATLSLLPLWAFMYVAALKPQEKVVEGPLAVGAAVYGSCAGCHGAEGQGGNAGRKLYQGEVMKTFPKIEDMLNFVYTGSQAYATAGLKVYGDPDREGGAHEPLSYNKNPMPMQGEKAGGALTEAEILGVVCHERYAISGADPKDEKWAAEYEMWCSPESEIFLALEKGTSSFETIDKDFSMLTEPPAHVGIEPRESGK